MSWWVLFRPLLCMLAISPGISNAEIEFQESDVVELTDANFDYETGILQVGAVYIRVLQV